MSAVATLAATVVAAVGAVAAYRFVDRKTRDFRNAVDEVRRRAAGGSRDDVDPRTIDYERDPLSGVYRPRESRPGESRPGESR